MKKMLVLGGVLLAAMQTFGQKVLSEGIINYNVTVVKGADQVGVADAFAGAKQTVMIKGYKARVNFVSPLRTQSEVYDAQTATGFVLKQSGADKYMIPLSEAKWQQFHARYKNVSFTVSAETKEVAGYTCKKAVGKLADGADVVVYFTPDLQTMAKGYDATFAGLDGLPLEYEITSNGVAINYATTSIQMTMVSAANFDAPKAGYKVLQYQ